MFRDLTIWHRFRRLLFAAAAALCLVPALTVTARAATYGYQRRTINAGILINGSGGPNPAPYVFYILNQRTDVKPNSWNLVNPLAPSIVTLPIQNRWGTNYSLGQSITPDMAAYWEVSLHDLSAGQLQQYDVLYLPAGGPFSVADNEKLRRYVDAGGLLWIEGVGSSPTFADTLLGTPSAATALALSSPRHPLFSQPNFFTSTDFAVLGTAGAGTPVAGVVSQAASGDFKNLFASVLTNGSGPVVVAGQLGAGQVIVTGLGIGGTINDFAGNTTGPLQYNNGAYSGIPGNAPGTTNFAAAPGHDLKFLCNLIAGADTHPSEQKNSHGNASGADIASAAVAPAWTYSSAASGSTLPVPTGAAIWGNFVYVTDAYGVLHCFNALPAKSLLTVDGMPVDDGLADYKNGTPYDEIWNAPVGQYASAPTVAAAPAGGTYTGITYVFVEKADGSVLQLNAVTGAATQLPLPAANPPVTAAYGTTAAPANAPAPAYYGGRLYAGQPNGDLYVYDFNGGSAAGGVRVALGAAAGDYALAAPSVSLLADTALQTNDLVALLPTNKSIYSAFLGTRGEAATPYPNLTAPTGYNVNRTRLGLFNLFVDMTAVPAPQAYTLAGNGAIGTVVAPSGNRNPDFNGSLGLYYDDYDVDFVKSTTNGSLGLTHTVFSGASFSGLTNSGFDSASFSSPAWDRAGRFYYTENANTGSGGTVKDSYLICARDAAQFSSVQMLWRFRMPTSGDDALFFYTDPANPLNPPKPWNYQDADFVDYSALKDFQFVGAPVADSRGYVYAAAKYAGAGGTFAAVLCFNTRQEVSADLSAAITNPGNATYQQPDEQVTQPGSPTPPIMNQLRVSQLTIGGSVNGGSTHVVFNNFAVGAGGSRQIVGNLAEPQPITVTPAIDPNNPTVIPAQPVQLHTNLAWYTTFPAGPNVSGLTQVGNTLFLSDGNTLYKVNATPQTDGTAINNKQIAYKAHNSADSKMMVTALPLESVTASNTSPPSAATPSAANGILIVNSLDSVTKKTVISALTQQLTLIADNNRVLETDADGSALWSVDATTQGNAAAGGTALDLNHPTSLFQLAPNDYLVADAGNNRCVRFDRTGTVLWELTRFSDPSNLLAPGESPALSGPTSVQLRSYVSGVNTVYNYLIADSGNNRIVEVTDTVNAQGNFALDTNGNPLSHILTWVSQTDKQGRRYRYGSAFYFNPTNPSDVNHANIVAALVTNTRIAPLTPNGLGPASGDAAGGSIVQLGYGSGQTNGYITAVATAFTGVNGVVFPVRNPRYLSVYAPPATPTAYSFLYADDNGAFDINPLTPALVATWQFLAGAASPNPPDAPQTTYHSMSSTSPGVPVPVDAAGDYPARNMIPFLPSCVQRIGTDTVWVDAQGNALTTPLYKPRYLVTQTGSQGEIGDPATAAAPNIVKIGGEVFEVDFDPTVGVYTYTARGGYSGHTLAKPGLTGPLTQPTIAIRPQQ